MDLLDFCLKHLETAESGNEIGDGLDIDEFEFLVSNQLIYYFLITYQCAGNSLPKLKRNQGSLEPEESFRLGG